MKKLMIAAAAVAMTFAAQAAGFGWKECENCGGGTSDTDCIAVFKVTGNGKAVVSVSTAKADYKTVGKITIRKGALALIGEVCGDDGQCCYSEGMFFATIKAGKKSFQFASEVELVVWSVFGKSLEQARDFEESVKPGKSLTLDSALFLKAEDADVSGLVDTGDIDLSAVSFWASAFGKVNFKVTKAGSGYCKNPKGCDPILTPKSYSGWFVGTYPCVGEENCFLCECADTDVFGGTWKATFTASAKTEAAAMKLAGVYVEEE